jgi:hypothetical protein
MLEQCIQGRGKVLSWHFPYRLRNTRPTDNPNQSEMRAAMSVVKHNVCRVRFVGDFHLDHLTLSVRSAKFSLKLKQCQ